MAPQPPRNFFVRIKTAIRNDPQKAGILTVLCSILLVLQVRLQLSEKDAGPSVAKAGTPAGGGGTAHNPPPLGGGNGGGSGSGAAHGDPGKPLDAVAALRVWMDAPTPELSRNLFAVD